MSNADMARVVLGLSAEVGTLRKDMDRAQKVVEGSTGKMARASQRAAKTMETSMAVAAKNMGADLAKAFAAPLLGLGIAGLVREVGNVAKGVAQVGDEAARAGLGVEAFQEYAYVAQRNRIAVDSVVDGFKELNLRADEFISTGAGAGAEAFGRLGYSAEELNRKLADPAALFEEIIGKLSRLDRAAAIRIADEIFGGTGGEKFVQLIDQGADGIARARQEARDLGLVMSADLIAKAADLDQKFNAVAGTVGTALKSAIVEASSALGSFIEQFQAFQNQSSAGLEQRLRDIGLKKLALDNQIVTMQTKLDRGEDLFGINRGALTSGIEKAREEITALVDQEAEILAILKSREPAGTPAPTGGGDRPSTVPATPGAVKRTAEILKFIEALEFEQEQLGRTAREQAIYNALHSAGSDLLPQHEARIRELVGANYDLALAQGNVQESMRAVADTASTTFRGIIDDLMAGTSAADTFANALLSIGGHLLDAGFGSLFGKGDDFGLAGSILGLPKREHGGPVRAGQPYVVGERRAELFVPSTSGTILPRLPSARSLASGAAGAITVNASTTIHAPNADAAGLARLEAMIRQRDAELPSRVIGAVRQARASRQL